jgi:dUTPase
MSITKYELTIYLSKNRDDDEWVSRYKEKVRLHNEKIIKYAGNATSTDTVDSGFDLFMPTDGSEYGEGNLIQNTSLEYNNVTSLLNVGVDGARALNLGVKCCMRVLSVSPTYQTESFLSPTIETVVSSADPVLVMPTTPLHPMITKTPCGFYLYPRSSISKTRMRLANSVGIIDSGYRGDIIAAVDTIGLFGSNDIWHIWKETLSPIKKYDRYFQICSPNLSPFLVRIVETEAELGAPTARGAGGFGSTGL